MRKRNWLLCVTACVILVCCFAQAEEAPGIFYRVEGGKNHLYLLGSIHVGSEDMYPLGTHILEALHQADTLVFECDTERPGALQDMLSLMYYPSGDGLDRHISPECLELLKKTAQKTGYSYEVLHTFKPWAVVSLFSVETTAAELGTADAEQALQLGVEAQIKHIAGEKTVRYLETAKQQLEIMDGFSTPLQEYMLSTACKTLLDPASAAGMDRTLPFWPEWWKYGETEQFAEAYQKGMAEDPKQQLMQEYHDALVSRRNKMMADEIAKLLEEEGSSFVTVGLMHLVLPGDSILSELEHKGYRIYRVLP